MRGHECDAKIPTDLPPLDNYERRRWAAHETAPNGPKS